MGCLKLTYHNETLTRVRVGKASREKNVEWVWLSVDPKAYAFPSVSPYTFNMNNPVMFIDPGGDSTMFFDARGNHLHTSHDGLENAVTVIPDDAVNRFNDIAGGIGEGRYESSDEMCQHARDLGTSYAVDDLKGFYNETTQNDIEGMPGYQPEYKTFLYKNGGMVRPGSERITDNLPNYVSGGKPSRSGSKGQAHTHPNADKSARAFGSRHAHRPSRADYNTHYNNNSYHDVVISPKYMYFINNTKGGGFAIPMKNTFNRGPARNAFGQ